MNFQEDTKKDIVKYVTMEIPLIRAGSRFLCGIKTQEDQFNKTGLSPKLIGQMFELVGGFCKMRPDSYETCLIAALCATSPDRGIRNATDYKILSNIQVRFTRYYYPLPNPEQGSPKFIIGGSSWLRTVPLIIVFWYSN